jgi:transcriptional regulator with XRE-family HTH domain
MTQAQLAAAVGLSRNTLNRLEAGLFPDLGFRKAGAILEKLGMELTVKRAKKAQQAPDFVRMACISAGVSFRKQLTPDELVHALLSGNPTPGKEAHFIVLLEEAPAALLKGLVEQVGAWVKPGKVERNLKNMAAQLGLNGATAAWRKIG